MGDSTVSKRMFDELQQSTLNNLKIIEENHRSEFERIETQLQENTFIKVETVTEKKLKEQEINNGKLKSSFDDTILTFRSAFDEKIKELEGKSASNTQALVEIEPIAKSMNNRLDEVRKEIIIESHKHFESFKSEVSTTMMKVTEKNNSVEKHYEKLVDNNAQIKEELVEMLKNDQLLQIERVKSIQEDTDKSLQNTHELMTSLNEKLQELAMNDKRAKVEITELKDKIDDSTSKLTNLESADLFLQESHRQLTEKSLKIENDLKETKSEFIASSSDLKKDLDGKIQLNWENMREDAKDVAASLNKINKEIADVDNRWKTNLQEVTGKQDNELIQLKKETNQRSTDLETTISQYYQQILTNSNSINDMNNRLQELVQLQQEQNDQNENKWLTQADNLKIQINALKEDTENLIEKHNQIYAVQSATLRDELVKKIKLNKDNIDHIDDTIDGLQKALIDHGDKHSQNVDKINELFAFTNSLKENFNQNVERYEK